MRVMTIAAPRSFASGLAAATVAALALASCTTGNPRWIDLMPAPLVFTYEGLDPFADTDPIFFEEPLAIVYATDRARASDAERVQYENARGYLLRAGRGEIELARGEYTWEEARRISLLKNRTEDYPLKVARVDEFGVLADSVSVFDDLEDGEPGEAPTRAFLDAIERSLARSVVKEINLYVHGYKVVFENPLLVVAELWHFLGYQSAFLAYSWPSTPARLAYLGDTDSAIHSVRNLRILIELLSRETSAERINILAYSAGTRLAVDLLGQVALIEGRDDAASGPRRLRIGDVILVGSDVDRDLMVGVLSDEVLGAIDRLTVYVSDADRALGISQWLFGGRERLGQAFDPEAVGPAAREFLRAHPELAFIHVGDAEGSKQGNGHAYFRKSPWVSSDILVQLRYGLGPAQRGLVRGAANMVWHFPPDYVERLRALLLEVQPGPATERAAAVARPD
jgi:esterase/lipase superfamily enzyme